MIFFRFQRFNSNSSETRKSNGVNCFLSNLSSRNLGESFLMADHMHLSWVIRSSPHGGRFFVLSFGSTSCASSLYRHLFPHCSQKSKLITFAFVSSGKMSNSLCFSSCDSTYCRSWST